MFHATIYFVQHVAKPGDIYVGVTLSFSRRARAHRQKGGDAGQRLKHWWRARSKTGIAPVVTPIATVEFPTRVEAETWLVENEAACIAALRADPRFRCLNSSAGGDGCREPTADTRKRMSEGARASRARKTPAERRAIAMKGVAARALGPFRERCREGAAARDREAHSRACSAGWAQLTPERRKEIGRKSIDSQTPEQLRARALKAVITLGADGCSERTRKRNAALTPEQRRASARKAVATQTKEQLRERARKGHAAQTKEQRSQRARKGHETRRGNGATRASYQKAARTAALVLWATRTPKERETIQNNLRAGHAKLSPERLSEIALKAWATRRANAAARASSDQPAEASGQGATPRGDSSEPLPAGPVPRGTPRRAP